MFCVSVKRLCVMFPPTILKSKNIYTMSMVTIPKGLNIIIKFCWPIIIFIVAIFLYAPIVKADTEEPRSEDSYARGQVVRVISEDVGIELNEPLTTQKLAVKIMNGLEKDTVVTVDYQIRGTVGVKKMSINEQVIVVKNTTPEAVNYYITEPFRLPAIGWLLVIFAAITVVFAGRRGAMAFLGLGLTMVIIGFFIIPQISGGANPFLVCIIGTALIASSSLFLAHGFNRETGLAFLSIMITITIAIALAYWAVDITRLFGMGSEEAYYLQFSTSQGINLRGLLLGGIIIGVLGVLDDVVTAQVAAVAELKRANAELSFGELYRRAARIGREHVTSVVNTLALAYVGASFPLLLLFTAYSTPWWVTLNTELISEEVVRTLIGSIALIAAVPLSTLVAAKYFSAQKK